MEKWDTGIAVDFAKTICKWDIYVSLVTKGLRCIFLLPTMTVIITSGAKLKSCPLRAMPQNTAWKTTT
jgi:hypothetical protein